MTRAPERHGDARGIEDPAHRKREHALLVSILCVAVEQLDRLEVLREAWRLELRVDLAQIVPWEPGILVEDAGQEAAAEGAIGERRDAMLDTPGQDLRLGLPLEQVERRLIRGERRDALETLN